MKGAKAKHQEDNDGRLAVIDGLKKEVLSTMNLKGEVNLTEKQEENRRAIGGMRQPRYSVRKVPGHRVIGAKVSSAIESFLRDHPHMMDKLLNSIRG